MEIPDEVDGREDVVDNATTPIGGGRGRLPRGYAAFAGSFRSSPRRKLVAILLASAALTLPVPASAQQTASPASTLSSRGYVDPKLCYGCHAAIYTAYSRTGMGRSFGKPAAANAIEDYTKNNRFYHAASGTWFEMLARGGEYFERRYQIGYAGRPTNVDETRVDYCLGSANHARSYLHRTSDGRLVQLPVTWYSENGGAWAMSPGYDSRELWYSQRGVPYECLFCHNSYADVPGAFRRRGDAQVYPATLPEGIDCQRCHGPGANHIRAAQVKEAKPGDLRRTIVNPSRLTADRQLEICMQCHLETTSMNLPESITRFDRAPFSYLPGEPLGAFRIFFDRAPGSRQDAPFEIAHSAYRLRESQCFLRSNGALTCTTCHNPHDTARSGQAAGQYDGQYDTVCRRCHSAAFSQLVSNGKHTQAPDCVDCHMPKRRTSDVVHAVMTDHLIERHRPEGDLLAARPERDTSEAAQYRGEVVPYYPDPLQKNAENELYVAIAQVRDKSNLADGIPRLTRAIDAAKPRRPEPYFELAEALRAQNQREKAVAAYREALRRDAEYLAALMGLGSALDEMGRKAEAADMLRRATQSAPSDARTWNSLGAVEFRLGHPKEAKAAFERAIALDAEMPEPRSGLGLILAQSGDRDGAERQFREAIRILPNYGNAHRNLGNLMAAARDLPQAAWELRLAADLLPADAAVRFNYAVTLSGLKEFADAELQVTAAIRLDNNFAEAHALLGNLLQRKDRMDDARREYETALRIRPDLGRAQFDLGALLAGKGDLAGATPHLRNAARSPDPALRALAEELMQRLGIRP
jgi:tetratricopeptide (TPR) repeat protein